MPVVAMQQFVAGLKSRHQDVRVRTAQELFAYVKSELREATPEEINSFLDDFNHHVFEMVSSTDVNEKKGGILAIICLINSDIGNINTRISRFANYLRNLLPSNDVEVMEFTAKTMGKLALVSGSKASEYAEFEVKRAFEWLSGDRGEGKRHAAVLVLRELALAMPTYFYQQVSQFFELIFFAVRDPKSKIREAAAEALRAALVVTAQRESPKQKPHWYEQCYRETIELLKVDKNAARDDRVHGALLVLNELLRSSNCTWERTYTTLKETTDMKQSVDEHFSTITIQPRFKSLHGKVTAYQSISISTLPSIHESSVCRHLIFEQYANVCQDVIAQSSSRSPHIQNVLFKILPRLAAFNKVLFSERYLNITMNYLLGTLKGREKERSTAFVTIGLIAVAVNSLIRPYVRKIMESVKLALPTREISSKKKITIDSSVFKCIMFLSHAVKDQIYDDVQNILEQMLSTGLTTPLTVCLRELAKHIPRLKQSISLGLLKMLSQILMNKPLHHPGMPRHLAVNVLPFAGFSDANDISSIVLALKTLGTYDFEGHSLLQFVQRCADYFLIHEEKEIRLETVRTCCRLLKHSLHTTAEHPSETVITTVASVLNKLLIVGIIDTQPEVRFWVLYSLDQTFDNHLAQAESLSALFVALNDEVFEIREVAMCIIGRLSTMNPAYVMPSLRKTLVQLLTELEHSGTGRNKEQSARMLDRLVVNAPRLIKPYMEPILKVCTPPSVNWQVR